MKNIKNFKNEHIELKHRTIKLQNNTKNTCKAMYKIHNGYVLLIVWLISYVFMKVHDSQ